MDERTDHEPARRLSGGTGPLALPTGLRQSFVGSATRSNRSRSEIQHAGSWSAL
jgi:hypothetical protein